MNLGIDLGYSAVKATTGEEGRIYIPSAVGTAKYDRSRFGVEGREGKGEIAIEYEGDAFLVGEAAIRQSRITTRREDREWIQSEEFLRLFLASLTEATDATFAEFVIVTGLPLNFLGDKEEVIDRLVGEYKVARLGRKSQTFRVKAVEVTPQGFGAVLSQVINWKGRVVRSEIVNAKKIGLIDSGAKTVNLVSLDGLREATRETTSINAGGWDVARSVKRYLNQHAPNLDSLRDHEIMQLVRDRRVFYDGEYIDLSAEIDDARQVVAEKIIAEVATQWNHGSQMEYLFLSGGGAILFGDLLKQAFPRLEVIDDPVFANANGFYKSSLRLAQKLKAAKA